MNLIKLREIVKDREAWGAAVQYIHANGFLNIVFLISALLTIHVNSILISVVLEEQTGNCGRQMSSISM